MTGATKPENTSQSDPPGIVGVDRPVRPRAWMWHYMGQWAVSFDPLDAGTRQAYPLYAPDDFVAEVVGLDDLRELAALLVDLDNIEDPERTPFPAIEDRDWRAHAGKCSRALRTLMRKIVGSGPNSQMDQPPNPP